jgi:hypothetical protein
MEQVIKENEKLTQADLDQFIGSQEYYRWSKLFHKHVLTEGVRYLCEKAQAYWLVDAIASYHSKAMKLGLSIQFWKLKVNLETRKAVLICERDEGDTVIMQRIPCTDFPLAEVRIWVESDGREIWTILLPSEH